MKDLASILNTAIDIVEDASKIALSYFRQPILIEMKENMTPVTIADKKTEEAIRKKLQGAFPGFGILGEEFGEESIDNDYVWTIDPIDGTRSFIRGIPLFGTLVGLLEKGKPVAGIMVLPALQETYSAATGLGTYCNGIQMHVSGGKSLSSSIVSIGDVSAFEHSGKGAYMQALLKKSELIRGYTDCFGHALVIRGSIDAMVDPIVSVWDVAPLACLIKEAGGEYFDLEGKENFRGPSFVSCTPELKEQLLKP